MTEHSTAQQQFADRLKRALGKHDSRGFGSWARRSRTSDRSFAERLRSSLGAR